MATTIVPALGAGILFTQGGTGASPGYSAIDRRRAYTPPLQAGVIAPTDFMVVQRAAGSNLSVDITMTAGGEAYVAGTSVSGQALYAVPVHASTVNEAITAAHATLPRIDSVYLVVQDAAHDASGQSRAQIQVVTGTATGGATLSNRTGAGAAPASSLLLADVLVAATDTAIANNEIRDRRPWARGANVQYDRTAGDYTTASATYVPIDATNLSRRIECSGAPVRVAYMGTLSHSAITSSYFGLFVDGTILAGGERQITTPGAGQSAIVHPAWVFTPAAGSHLFELRFRTDAATLTLKGGATQGAEFTIEEIVRQNVANNAVTSG